MSNTPQPPNGNYPGPPDGGPPQGFPPPQPGYPPPQPVNPPPGYPPAGYPPPQPGYPPPQPEYPPAQGYPPQPGYPPAQGYPPQPGYPPAQGYPPQGGYPQGGYPPPPTRRAGMNPARLIGFVAVPVIVIIALVVVLAHNSASGGSVYSVTAPGPKCDTQGGDWSNATTPNYSLVCQSGGTAMTMTAKQNSTAEIFFNGPNSSYTFPSRYTATVSTNFTAGGQFTAAGLEVHRQTQNGGQIFEVFSNGEWKVNEFDTSGNLTGRLAIGFLKNAGAAHTLSVAVNGAQMTFTIDDQVVDIVTSTRYAATDSVGLSLDDAADDTATPAVTFSHFSFAPNGNATLSANQAVASATALATSQGAYQAQKPGFGCDTGAGQWMPLANYTDGHTTITCAAGGLNIGQDAVATTATAARFFGRDGNFATNYQVSADINVSQVNGGCAGFGVRRQDSGGGYYGYVCDDGSWELDYVDTQGNGTALNNGNVSVKASYHVVMGVNGSTLSLALDGAQVGTASDTHFTTTSFISLLMFAGTNSAGTATFSNFVYTPQP